MNKKAIIVGLAALGAIALLLYAPRASAATVESDDAPAPDVPNEPVYDAGAAGWIDTFDTWAQQLYSETVANAMPLQMPINAQTNMAAMLAAISHAEGTAGQADPYRVCYAYRNTIDGKDGISGNFDDWVDHPAITGEWLGERLSDKICAGAGLSPGCVSTAAGKYQIIKKTWLGVKSKLGLTDFSPASQDAAAIELLRQRGALVLLERGDFVGAVEKAKKEWASLPGAGYGQGERSIAWLTEKFTDAGGVLA